MQINRYSNVLLISILALFFISTIGCVHLDFKLAHNEWTAIQPIYKMKLGVLNFEDKRADDEKNFDDYLNTKELAKQYTQYLAEDLQRSNIFTEIIYIDNKDSNIQNIYGVDAIMAGEIKRLYFKSSFSAWNLCYIVGGEWWVFFNLLGLPIPPFVGLYQTESTISVKIYVPSKKTDLLEDVAYLGDEFYSPTTFWYHLATEGKLNELMQVLRESTRRLGTQISKNYRLREITSKTKFDSNNKSAKSTKSPTEIQTPTSDTGK